MADFETNPQRIFLFGATGTIGRAVARELSRRGLNVAALIRKGADVSDLPSETMWHRGDATDADWVSELFAQERYDAVISCLASRTGAPKDAWKIDHQAHSAILAAAAASGVPKFVQLSALCVQKPKLAFQQAKLAFEAELMVSGLDYSIVRPTAFFKSLSGQIERVKAGKPFLLFGDGNLTACKPISDRDLAAYLCNCLGQDDMSRKILPIGGPGPALTPREQGQLLFEQAGIPPKFQSVAPGLFKAAASVLETLGIIVPPLQEKAALVRIAHYYATESMLVWDEKAQRYSAEATPSFGSDRLTDHYAAVLAGDDRVALGDHALFGSGA